MPGSRDPFAPRPLLAAAVAAAVGAALGTGLGLIGVALVAVGLLAWGFRPQGRGAFYPLLLAMPAALAAAADRPARPDEAPVRPVAGSGCLVEFAGEVIETTRWVRFRPGPGYRLRMEGRDPGAGHRTAILSATGSLDALPGDRVTGLAWQRRPGFLETHPDCVQVQAGAPSFTRGLAAVRRGLQRALATAVDPDVAPLLSHLVLGGGAPMPRSLVDAHRGTGLTHLLAVSGAHASMLAWLLALAYRSGTGRNPGTARRFPKVCAVILTVYAAITGFEAPVCRALCAYGILLLAAARGRPIRLSAALAAPALLTALLAPASLFTPSFTLSYAAVLGLGLSAGSVAPGVGTDTERWLLTPLRASVWAVLLTAPWTLFWFQQLAPWTVLWTPLLAPWVALMLGLGLPLAVLGTVSPAAVEVPAALLSWLARGYTAAVELADLLPGTPVNARTIPEPGLLLSWAGCCALLLVWWRGRRAVACFCGAVCLPWFVPGPGSEAPRLELLDVGHGQAALAFFPDGRQVLVDCGSLGRPERAARRVVDRLSHRREIDLLILSHGDADHAGGVPELLRQLTVSRCVLPATMEHGALARRLRSSGVVVEAIPAGMVHTGPGWRVVSPPLTPGEHSRNERSLWVELDLPDLRCTLPGDAGPRTLGALQRVGRADLRPCDVLVLPHHGRGSAGFARQLHRQLAPAIALTSDRPGAPGPLCAVFRSLGVPVERTATRGRITLRCGSAGPELHGEYPSGLPR